MKTIKIRNNISSKLVKRHLKRVKIDEEEERKQRAASYQSLWGQNSNTNSPVTVYIYFYEWSTLTGTMKTFTEYRQFFKFCAESNIEVTELDRSILYGSNCNYVVCKPGENKLMISNTYCGLHRKLYEKEEVTSNVLTFMTPQRQLPFYDD